MAFFWGGRLDSTHADGVAVKEVAPHNYSVLLLIQKQNQQRSDLIQIAHITTKTWSMRRPQNHRIEVLARIFHLRAQCAPEINMDTSRRSGNTTLSST